MALVPAILLTSILAWEGVSSAEGPAAVVHANGAVSAELELDASMDATLAWISSPDRAIADSPEVIGVQTVADGACQLVAVTAKGFLSPIVYRARRCPTATGWTESLLDSEDLATHEIEWVVEPGPQHTRVRLKVRVLPRISVPQSFVVRAVKKSVSATLARLQGDL